MMNKYSSDTNFIGLALAHFRRVNNLTQVGLCKVSGVSVVTITSIEKRKNKFPSVETLSYLCIGLKMPIGLFMTYVEIETALADTNLSEDLFLKLSKRKRNLEKCISRQMKGEFGQSISLEDLEKIFE